jgi:HEPN domain-containing protein
MSDLNRQAAYWLKSSEEDWEVAQELVTNGRTRHGLFFAHLAIEKVFKALICQQTEAIPPKTHNLLLLASKTDLALSDEQKLFLARFDQYQIEGRYPEMLPKAPTREKAAQELAIAQEMITWLRQKLPTS